MTALEELLIYAESRDGSPSTLAEGCRWMAARNRAHADQCRRLVTAFESLAVGTPVDLIRSKLSRRQPHDGAFAQLSDRFNFHWRVEELEDRELMWLSDAAGECAAASAQSARFLDERAAEFDALGDHYAVLSLIEGGTDGA
jgi:hypothetical protein